MVKIGVLDLQGGVIEHLNLLNQIPEVTAMPVKKKKELKQIDGLILPGGESTTLGKLLSIFELKDLIIQLAQQGLPIWGTCAGMILLATELKGTETSHLNLMNITVQRNGYGNQLASFKTRAQVPKISSQEIPLVFIRAPYVSKVNPEVEVLLKLDDKIVAVEQNNLLATSFHPELTEDLTCHRYFVNQVKESI